MHTLFSEEHNNFRQRVAKFVREEIDPKSEEWNEKGDLPREVWLRMGELGFLGASFEKKYGGHDLDVIFLIILAEELGRSKVSGLSWSVGTGIGIAARYLLDAAEDVKMKYLPKCITGESICSLAITEPDAGSDVASIKTKAEKHGDYYVINGEKTFITNGHKADLVMLAVKTDLEASPAYKGISLLLVEDGTKGFSKGEKLHKMGMVTSDTTELFFDDCRVPTNNLLGKENGGFKTMMQHLAWERLMGTALYITACEEILKTTKSYGSKPTGPIEKISSLPVDKHQLVDIYTETALAKTFFYDCCDRFVKGEKIDKEISMVKYYSSELANKIVNVCLSFQGANGYLQKHPLCQWFNDVRVYNIGAGTTEVMKEIIAGQLGL